MPRPRVILPSFFSRFLKRARPSPTPEVFRFSVEVDEDDVVQSVVKSSRKQIAERFGALPYGPRGTYIGPSPFLRWWVKEVWAKLEDED